jgi:hypothetical protein
VKNAKEFCDRVKKLHLVTGKNTLGRSAGQKNANSTGIMAYRAEEHIGAGKMRCF